MKGKDSRLFLLSTHSKARPQHWEFHLILGYFYPIYRQLLINYRGDFWKKSCAIMETVASVKISVSSILLVVRELLLN